MVANQALKNNLEQDAVLSSREVHPLALEGAKRLISAHAKTPVLIKSWGTPEIVYRDVQNSLMQFGYSKVMAEEMAEKLVEHAIDHAEQSREKYGANIIALKIEVSQRKPNPQFETGAMEAQRIDGISNQAQVAGATSIAIGLSTSGTTTTAARDAVGEILDSIAGKPAVWIHFESPNKSELQGVANDAAMAAIAQISQGGMDAGGGSVVVDVNEATAQALETLNFIQQEGIASPAIQGLVDRVVEIGIANTNSEPKAPAQVQQMADQVLQAASQAIAQGEMPPEMASTVIQAVSEMGRVEPTVVADMTQNVANTQQVPTTPSAESPTVPKAVEVVTPTETSTTPKAVEVFKPMEASTAIPQPSQPPAPTAGPTPQPVPQPSQPSAPSAGPTPQPMPQPSQPPAPTGGPDNTPLIPNNPVNNPVPIGGPEGPINHIPKLIEPVAPVIKSNDNIFEIPTNGPTDLEKALNQEFGDACAKCGAKGAGCANCKGGAKPKTPSLNR